MYSRVTLVILIIVIIWLLNSVWSVYKKQDMTRDNLAKIAASLESLQAREKMLSDEIESLKTESGREAEIREKYGLVKPGEEVIVVVDKDGDNDDKSADLETGFWGKIKNWFR